MALQFESNLQNLVYQVDAGTGRRIIHVVVFALFAIAMAALCTFANFQGLKDPRAMEEAQLARSLARGEGMVTRTLRPLSIGRLAERSESGEAPIAGHPDLRHPPVWPVILAGVFRLTGVPEAGVPTTAFVGAADYVPVAVNHLFTLLSAVWVWLIGRKLFDRRVGALSVGAFLISQLIWRQSLLGGDLSTAMFFGLGAVYAALWAAELPRNLPPEAGEGPVWRWLVPLVLSALGLAAAFLTRYAAGTLGLAVFLYLGLSRRRRSWWHALLFAALAFLAVVPWLVRNAALAGHPLGLAGTEMLAGTHLFPGDALARSFRPELPDAGAALYHLNLKMMANLRAFAAEGFGLAEGGFLLGLFGAMYLHRFVRPSSRTLRWCLLPAGTVMALVAAANGEESLRALVLYWPLAIPYAWAFFLVLLDRLQFELRHFAAGVLAIGMFLAGLPLLLNVLPPRTGLPYPPYFHRYIGPVAAMLAPEECMVTDIPWATAWYGDRISVLLPQDIEGFFELHRGHQPVAMAYFTTETRNKPWVRELSDPTSPEHDWYQLFAGGLVPEEFPLSHARYISGGDQFILADQPRWTW